MKSLVRFIRSGSPGMVLAVVGIIACAAALYVGLSLVSGSEGALPQLQSHDTAPGAGDSPSSAGDGSGGDSHDAKPRAVDGVVESAPVTYGNDGYFAQGCSGPPSSKLHYTVFYPSTRGPHPIVFGMSGSGFAGTASCDPKIGKPLYQDINSVMVRWAQAGYVAVNIEYHGYENGLYGAATYPGAGKWGTTADGTVQLDVKPAVEYFLAHDPGQYGADAHKGLIAFGASSGAHNAYMLSLTGVPGHRFSAAAGWSGLPDASMGGFPAERAFDGYMQTQPGTDLENFADPEHRITSKSPPQYIANGAHEFIAAANAQQYFHTCTHLKIPFCYERILATSDHAGEYEAYTFTGKPPEVTSPQARTGQTVLADTIGFANAVLHRH